MKLRTQTRTQTATTQTRTQSTGHKRAPNKTYGAASAERFGDYIIELDNARGGYTYGDDWSGDDLRALCDIFGA